MIETNNNKKKNSCGIIIRTIAVQQVTFVDPTDFSIGIHSPQDP